ncbi:MAG: hypothetical protein ACJ761_00120 [Chloroflexota bacterium]
MDQTRRAQHDEHAQHGEHEHSGDCGHEGVAHGDHTDYMHDGHQHGRHEGHWDEHAMATSSALTPGDEAPMRPGEEGAP